jgi:calcineurin-like phosphoesterase family protein
MDKTLIGNWNATVQEDDEVYILGDFTMRGPGHAKAYLSALNGRKYMIVGNHDLFLEGFGETEGWFEWVKDYAIVSYDGATFVLFHYPIVEWFRFGKGSIHLHGHLHNSKPAATQIPPTVRAFNVGVDVCDFKPVGIDEILRRANKVAIISRHHDE